MAVRSSGAPWQKQFVGSEAGETQAACGEAARGDSARGRENAILQFTPSKEQGALLTSASASLAEALPLHNDDAGQRGSMALDGEAPAA